MQSLTASNHHHHSSPLSSRTNFASRTPKRTLQCGFLLPSSSSSPKPKPLKSSFKTSVASSSAATLLFHIHALSREFGGGGSGGWGFGGGGDGDGGNGGSFCRRFLSPAVANAKEPQNEGWDSHGLPANIVVQLNKLSDFKKYKVSKILFFDKRRWTTVDTEDSFLEMVSLRPNGIYNKAQLQKELETLATCGMVEKVDMEGKTNSDGTIGVTISFMESTWQSVDKFRCINVGLMPV